MKLLIINIAWHRTAKEKHSDKDRLKAKSTIVRTLNVICNSFIIQSPHGRQFSIGSPSTSRLASMTDMVYTLRPGNFVFSRLMTEERDGNVFYAEHLLCAPH